MDKSKLLDLIGTPDHRQVDSIPNEKFSTSIFISDTVLQEALRFADAFVERVADHYQAAAGKGREGTSLAALEAIFHESGYSDVEGAFRLYGVVQYLIGETSITKEQLEALIGKAGELPLFKGRGPVVAEIRTALERMNALEERRLHLAHERERLLISEVAVTRARNEYKLEKERLEASSATDRRLTAESEERTATYRAAEARSNAERIALEERRKAEIATTQARAEAEQRAVRRKKELPAYTNAVLDAVVALETHPRHLIMRDICRETGYIIQRDSIAAAVRAELTHGSNLHEMPWEPRRTSGEYVNLFLRSYLGELVLARLATVEGDKDRAMIHAFESLFATCSTLDPFPDAKTLTLEQWETALRNIDGGLDELIAVYTMAAQEDSRLHDAITARLAHGQKEEYSRVAQVLDNILRQYIPEWKLPLPTVSDEASFQQYYSLAAEEFKARTVPKDETHPLHIGCFVRVSGSNPTNITNKGVYRLVRNHYGELCIATLKSSRGDGVYIDSRQADLSALRKALDGCSTLLPLSFDGVAAFCIEDADEQGVMLPFRTILGRYHPHFEIEFRARELYNGRMIERFKRLKQ